MTKNEVKNDMVCPNCGSHDIVFVTTTDALFEVNPDGSIGKPVLDADGIECISDISEIDADAFALAYMKNRTSYPASEYMEQLNVYMSFDRGARKNRSRSIRNKYFN